MKYLSRRHLLAFPVAGVCAAILVDGTVQGQGASTPNVDQDTQRYEDLTASEMVSMTVGIPRQQTNPHQGQRIMQLSLDLEHLIAVQPLDPAQASANNIRRIRQFRDELQAISGIRVLLHILGDFMGPARDTPDVPTNGKMKPAPPPAPAPKPAGACAPGRPPEITIQRHYTRGS